MDKELLSKNTTMLALGFISLIIVLLLIYTQLVALKEVKMASQHERLMIDRNQIELQELLYIRDQADYIKKLAGGMERLLPSEPEEDLLMLNIDTICKDAGVELTKISFEQRVEHKDYIEMPLKMTFQGGYHGFISLLSQMQDGPRALRLDEVKVVQDDQYQDGLKTDITASAFYAKR